MIRLTLPLAVPSANAWTNKQGNWRIYAGHRNQWMVVLRSLLTPVTATKAKAWCRITSYRQRLLDDANLVGGAKPIPDCLKRLGYIYDDRPEYFACQYAQHKAAKGERRTVLELSSEPMEAVKETN